MAKVHEAHPQRPTKSGMAKAPTAKSARCSGASRLPSARRASSEAIVARRNTFPRRSLHKGAEMTLSALVTTLPVVMQFDELVHEVTGAKSVRELVDRDTPSATGARSRSWRGRATGGHRPASGEARGVARILSLEAPSSTRCHVHGGTVHPGSRGGEQRVVLVSVDQGQGAVRVHVGHTARSDTPQNAWKAALEASRARIK